MIIKSGNCDKWYAGLSSLCLNASRRSFIKVIHAYRYLISPLFPPSCRFYPSCSAYMENAILRYGVFKGGYLGIKRLLKCHPWHPGGYDPVP